MMLFKKKETFKDEFYWPVIREMDLSKYTVDNLGFCGNWHSLEFETREEFERFKKEYQEINTQVEVDVKIEKHKSAVKSNASKKAFEQIKLEFEYPFTCELDLSNSTAAFTDLEKLLKHAVEIAKGDCKIETDYNVWPIIRFKEHDHLYEFEKEFDKLSKKS